MNFTTAIKLPSAFIPLAMSAAAAGCGAWSRRHIRRCPRGRRGCRCSSLAVTHGRASSTGCVLRNQVAASCSAVRSSSTGASSRRRARRACASLLSQAVARIGWNNVAYSVTSGSDERTLIEHIFVSREASTFADTDLQRHQPLRLNAPAAQLQHAFGAE